MAIKVRTALAAWLTCGLGHQCVGHQLSFFEALEQDSAHVYMHRMLHRCASLHPVAA
jgi:hypothetical protein